MNADTHRLETPDPERQAQARRYARLRRRLIPVSLGLAWDCCSALAGRWSSPSLAAFWAAAMPC